MTYEEKLEKAASLTAALFSVAIKEAIEGEVGKVFTEDVANDMGIAMAETLIGFFGEDILSVLIDEGKKYMDAKIESALPKLLAEARLQLVGLEVGYARPWWARWLGLPGKVKVC